MQKSLGVKSDMKCLYNKKSRPFCIWLHILIVELKEDSNSYYTVATFVQFLIIWN